MLAIFGPTPGVYEYIVDVNEYESIKSWNTEGALTSSCGMTQYS